MPRGGTWMMPARSVVESLADTHPGSQELLQGALPCAPGSRQASAPQETHSRVDPADCLWGGLQTRHLRIDDRRLEVDT